MDLNEIQTHTIFMVFLVTCKNEEDSSKNEGTRVVTRFLPLFVCGDFSNAQGQLSPKSLVRSCRISNPFEILWLHSLPARIYEPIKNEEARVTEISPIITLWELSVAMETKVLIGSGPKPKTDNPHRNDAPGEILLQSVRDIHV